jgi:hypothetical protein
LFYVKLLAAPDSSPKRNEFGVWILHEFVSFVRESCSSHERLKGTIRRGFRRHGQGLRTGIIQEVLVDFTIISFAMVTVQEEASPVPQNNGRLYKFDEEADPRLLKCVSLHGAHLAI